MLQEGQQREAEGGEVAMRRRQGEEQLGLIQVSSTSGTAPGNAS